MTTAVSRRYDTLNREEDCGSETSTLKGSFINTSSISTSRTFGRPRYVNCATCIKKQIFKSESYSSDSDDADFNAYDDDNEEEETNEYKLYKPPSITITSRIDLSPEAEARRKEAYDKWLNSVTNREKERKRLSKERLQAEIELQLRLQEERKQESDAKVGKWLSKKKIEAEKEMARIMNMKKAMDRASKKPKEFKKAINFQDWINKKNEDVIAMKKTQEEKKIAKQSLLKVRGSVSSASYDRWVHTAMTKAKPVPFSKGLASLSGSTTKIYINPTPWKFDE